MSSGRSTTHLGKKKTSRALLTTTLKQETRRDPLTTTLKKSTSVEIRLALRRRLGDQIQKAERSSLTGPIATDPLLGLANPKDGIEFEDSHNSFSRSLSITPSYRE